MKTLVTGGAGFIGSHLVERLLAEGHDVTVIDNFTTGRQANLDLADPEGRVRLVRVDVADPEALRPHFEGVEWVFHLAALADIVPSIDHPMLYHRTNVDGTIAVLEAARAAGTLKKLVYVASSSSYGFPDTVPTPEEEPIRPTHPYGLTKALGEQYVLSWAKMYRLPTVSLRLFNVYGLRSRTSGAYGAVFGVFLKQKLDGHPFTVVGDGTQTRDFTYVTDVVNALVTAAASDVSGECFNVGSGHTYSVNRLVELLGGEIVYVPKRPGEPDCTFADTAKIRRVLGWAPKVSFEEGVSTMVENIEMWRDAPLWTVDSIADATRQWFKYLKSEA
ncbi:UDP-glucose 4-epimerase [Tistlia consotensis]|uniref:UDP-glucose 4-epimerase n=1 Tax=Tistlia consotensis USBA 355 TaxID=560819 RepID=A0A1Y6BEB3_9PROT|nr:SDR family oxidoreductase [Tistlia consotensis]SME99083.1 UDP-glucose 4-epimerase [Tistlia consotensis USBA 355]SNR77394.1 UDP-glucose 4-epimerase [Tistlia consotensis]